MPGRPHLTGGLAALLLLTACSGGPVDVATPDLDEADRAACEAFVAALPATLADEEPREIAPSDALGAAYGDPAIVVRCGVAVPADFDEASSACEIANDVGWYVAPAEFEDQDADVTLTAAGFRPVVEVRIPGELRPDSPAAAIAELAAPVDEHLTLVANCN